jgi:oryzin
MQFFTRVVAIAIVATPFFANAAPVSAREAADEIIPGKYIVQLKPEADVSSVVSHLNVVREIHARNLAKREVAVAEEKAGIEREFGFGDFKGYSGAFDAATVEELKALPEVRGIQPVQTHLTDAHDRSWRSLKTTS